jgi:O-acetyl-ADP-ribose deacetylase (regulator of RNase III)
MIQITRGNLLKADAEALVNTVNTVGVMGKGIALQFKQAFPDNYAFYRMAYEHGELQPGRMLVFETSRMINPRYIFNFPTKRHWRGKSRLEDIRAGLDALVDEIRRRKIASVAIPPLGCGNGGLGWGVIRPLIEAALEELPEVETLLFEPRGAPDAKTMPGGTPRPKMTRARALLIKLLDRYSVLGYSRTLLEAQKLAYFLQEAGEPLRLRYERGHYGPYAANLNKVFETLEGHFTRGYGDSQSPEAQLEMLPGAVDEADHFLSGEAKALARLDRLAALIEGFETPYGMELLASVHWVACREKEPAREPGAAAAAIRRWTRRKAELFQPFHVKVAWERLEAGGWLRDQ